MLQFPIVGTVWTADYSTVGSIVSRLRLGRHLRWRQKNGTIRSNGGFHRGKTEKGERKKKTPAHVLGHHGGSGDVLREKTLEMKMGLLLASTLFAINQRRFLYYWIFAVRIIEHFLVHCARGQAAY